MDTLEGTDRISFGLFEVDLQAGELWRAGHKIKLPAQPFKVLVALLSKPGEVVSREELQHRVWGEHTNVDFERAVAGTINKIREALGDSAENPRFIQTLPKRGYRFIAPVTSTHQPTPAIYDAGPPHRVSAASHVPISDVPPSQVPLSTEDHASLLATPPAVLYTQPAAPAPLPGRSLRRLPLSSVLLLGLASLCLLACLLVWQAGSRPEPAPLRVDQLTNRGAISTGPPNPENLLTLATDGNRILTSVMENGRPRLSAISLSTGEVTPLALPQEVASSLLADISKDGSKLLLRSHLSSASEQPLWIVPASGGSALRVGNVLAHDASWMPDGRSILYANGNDLAIIQLNTGMSTPFARLQGRAFWMRWSPNARKLRFTLLDPVTHSFGIWELGDKGGVPRRMATPDPDHLSACCGTWTADGSAYLFQAGDNLWSAQEGLHAGTPVQLTNGPLRFLSPVTARSGSRVFFLGLDRPSGMQMFDEKEGFRPAPAFLANATRVTFSRDGQWVAWTDNAEQLWRARAADGSDKVQLTPPYLEVFMAHWSPDARRLAVMAREPGKLWRTYLVDADGGNPEPLLNEDRNAADPGWSADGQELVFGREPDQMGKESGSHAIQTLNLATGQVDVLPGSEGLFSPRWSPDGRWIAALSLNQKNVMIYDVGRQTWRELARTSAADPTWGADSQSLFVHAFLEDEQPILKIAVSTGKTEKVADLSAFHDRATVNYFFGGLTPRGEPMVEPRIGTGDLYTLDLKVH